MLPLTQDGSFGCEYTPLKYSGDDAEYIEGAVSISFNDGNTCEFTSPTQNLSASDNRLNINTSSNLRDVAFKISGLTEVEKGIQLEILDSKGKLVRSYSLTNLHSELIWDGMDTKNIMVSSGLYFVRLNTSKNSLTKKLLYLP